MKTLLTINSTRFLLPSSVEPESVFKLLRGLELATPESSHPRDSYDDYFSGYVRRGQTPRLSLEIVPDCDVITAEEFAAIKARHQAIDEAQKEQAVSRA